MATKKELTDAQKLVRANKTARLSKLCEIIHNKASSNDGRMSHRYVYVNFDKRESKRFYMVNSRHSRYKLKISFPKNSNS